MDKIAQKSVRYIWILVASAWFFFVIFQWLKSPENYYSINSGIQIIQNFFAIEIWKGIGQFFWNNLIYNIYLIFLASFFVLSSYGYGRFFLIKFLKSDYSVIETFIFSNALGFGITGNIILFFAVCHVLYKTAILFSIAAGILFFLKSLKLKPIENNLFLASPILYIKNIFRKLSLFEISLLLIIVFSLLLSFFSMFSPDIREDTLNYHLAMPSWYLMNHGIADMPHNIYYNLFSLYGCVYAAAMGISDYMLPRAVNFFVVIYGMLIIPAYLTRKYFGGKYILLTLSIICTTYQFHELEFLTGSDSFSVFFVLSMFSSVLMHKTGNKKTLCITAILAGFAMATKATSLTFVIPAMLIIFAMNRNSPKEKIKEMLIFIAISSLSVMPWLIKNYIFRGNPFFPFLTGFFRLSSDYDPVLIEHFKKATNLLAGHKFHAIKTIWNLFFATHTGYNILTSPFILAIAGFIPFIFEKKFYEKGKQIMFFAVVSFVLMIPSSGISRFYLPIFAVAAIFYANCLYDAQEKKKIIALPLVLILVFFMIPSVFMFNHHGFYDIPIGNMTKMQYLRSRFGYTDAILWANANIPEKSKILISDLIGRSFYCERSYYVTSLFDKYWHESNLSGNETSEEILSKLKRQGFTHILHNSDKLQFSPSLNEYRAITRNEKTINNLKTFSSKYLNKIYVSDIDNTTIYEISYDK